MLNESFPLYSFSFAKSISLRNQIFLILTRKREIINTGNGAAHTPSVPEAETARWNEEKHRQKAMLFKTVKKALLQVYDASTTQEAKKEVAQASGAPTMVCADNQKGGWTMSHYEYLRIEERKSYTE